MAFSFAFILWPFFWLGVIAVIGYAFSLFYHWLRYGNMYPLVWVAMPIYAVGTLIFLGAMISGIAAV